MDRRNCSSTKVTKKLMRGFLLACDGSGAWMRTECDLAWRGGSGGGARLVW